MNHVGDAIATLQVDENGNKPAPAQAVMNLIDNLQTSSDKSSADKSSAAAPVQGKMMRCVKYAAILSFIFAILTLPFISGMFDTMFTNCWAKTAVQALAFFIVAVIMLYTISKNEQK